jgi:glyoxylate/hydroxypyruvate reductase A
MLTVLFSAREALWVDYREPLPRALAEAGLDAEVVLDADPGSVDYIVFAPNGPVSDFTPYVRARAVLSLWAGVETVVGNRTLTQPLARMVDPALTEGMVEYVTGHVLRHHLGMDRYIHGLNGVWRQDVPPLARERSVAILGLGELGQACAEALARLNFRVLGWSRRQRTIPGVLCRSGHPGLLDTLAEAEILVLLLPLTHETEGLMDADRLGRLPEGAVIVNPGRGALIDEPALIAALDKGDLAHATLDVFRTEPLPADHPFWSHPKVTVTPHIASETRPASASRVIAENIRRSQEGEPLLYLVDRAAGY